VEARVIAVVLRGDREEIFDSLRGDAPKRKGFTTVGFQGVGVQDQERVGGAHGTEGMLECQQAREVFVVCDECGPDYGLLVKARATRDGAGDLCQSRPYACGVPLCVPCAIAFYG